MRSLRISAALEAAAGLAALALLVVAYAVYGPRLREALRQLDAMAGGAEAEIDTSAEVLEDLHGVLTGWEETAGRHEQAIDRITETVRTAAATADAWGQQARRFSGIARDAGAVCDRFAKALPVRIPEVTVGTRRVAFQVPEITPKSQTVRLRYPATAVVKAERKQLRVPTGITVDNKEYKIKVLGADVSFSYPAAVRTEYADVSLDYPGALEVKEQELRLEAPATPEVRMKDQGFEAPGQVEVRHRELLRAEKDLLQKTADGLTSASDALAETQKTLAAVRGLLDGQVVKSLGEARDALAGVKRSLERLTRERLPGTVQRLKAQKAQVRGVRGLFSATEGLLPLAAVAAALVPVGMIASAVGKLWGSR